MEQKNLINELMANIKNMDRQKALNEIFQLEEKKRGINWRAVFNGSNDYDEKLTEVFSKLNEELGLNMDSRQFKANPIKFLRESDEIQTVANYSVVNEEGHMAIDYVQSLRGKDLANYVIHMTQKLEFAEQSRSYTEIGLDVAAAGLFGVGVEWTVKSFRALETSASALEACIAGARALGTLSKVIAVISLVVIVVLIPFLIFMEKKAEMLILIMNRTNEDIDIYDYYMKHGKVMAKPYDTDIERTPPESHSIIAGRYLKLSEAAMMGTLYVTKRDYALYGVMGACKLEFSKPTYFPNGVYLGFKTPLAKGDNAGFITAKKYNDAEDFYNKTEDFKLETFEDTDKYHLQACVNSESGGEPVMIAIIQSKK